jgi:small-conductance mechanosensitive channel
MQKTLKTFVLLNLMLAGVALWKGIEIYKERQVIKSRIQRNERAAVEIGTKLKMEENALGTLRDNIRDHNQLDALLVGLEKHAHERQLDLETTRGNLESTRQELATTKDVLNSTTIALESSRAQVASLQADKSRLEDDLVVERRKIENLGNQIGALRTEIAGLNERVAEKEQEITTQATQIEQLEAELKVTQLELAACKGPVTPKDVIGKTANVITVNTDWNFVIVDKGRHDFFVPNLRAVINRGEQYLGTVRIASVKDKISVCDIVLGDMAEGVSLREGDTIFFPPNLLE